MSVGQNIKTRRKELGMNAETIAEKLGVSPSTIYRYEKGDIEKVDSAKLIQIAEILRTTPAELMGWEEEENKEEEPKKTERPKWIKLTAGTRTIPDEELDFIYNAAHLVDPERFPLD